MVSATWTSTSFSSYTCQSCRTRCQHVAPPTRNLLSSIVATRSSKWRRRWQMVSWGVHAVELQSFWSFETAVLSIVSGQWGAFSRQTKIQRFMLMGEPTMENFTLSRSAIMRRCGTHLTSWPKSWTRLLCRMCLIPPRTTSATVKFASKRKNSQWKITTAKGITPWSDLKNVQGNKQNWATQIRIVMTSWTLLCFKIRPIFSSSNQFLTKICHSTRQYILQIIARTASRKPSNSSLACYPIRSSLWTSHLRAPGREWFQALLLVLDKVQSMMEYTEMLREAKVATSFDLNLNLKYWLKISKLHLRDWLKT